VKAYASTLGVLGVPAQEKRSGYRVRSPRAPLPAGGLALVEVSDGTVPFAAVGTLAHALGVEAQALLAVVGMSPRTAARRKAEGALTAAEADRLLRVARVFEEATRVFGTQNKAATWLRTTAPLLGSVEPYRLLESDAGAKAVSDELIRIEFGDFA
jgi:putative toxin-antitoxin system antitoxin component (TIGR02293 family)